LVIADNGHGFDWNQVQSRSAATVDGIRLATGNGVLNMQKRLEEVGGRCQWDTAPGEGTRVKLRILVKL
jgi:signal transduction histidine kinase